MRRNSLICRQQLPSKAREKLAKCPAAEMSLLFQRLAQCHDIDGIYQAVLNVFAILQYYQYSHE